MKNIFYNIEQWLMRPYPTEFKRIEDVSISCAVIIAILFILQPFGLQNGSMLNTVMFILVSIISYFIAFLIIRGIKHCNKKSDKSDTFGSTILSYIFEIVITAIGIWSYQCYTLGHIYINQIFTFIGYVSIVTIFIATIRFFFNRSKILKKELEELQQFNQLVTTSNNTTKEPKNLHLIGSTKDYVDVSSNEILYIEANGNYSNIVCGDNTYTLRATIKQLMQQLNGISNIAQCHRSFIVNLSHIDKLDGNAQGYVLTLYNKSKVPMSRSFAPKIKQILEI